MDKRLLILRLCRGSFPFDGEFSEMEMAREKLYYESYNNS